MTTAVFPPIMNIHVRAADRELLFKALAVGSYEGTKSALIFMNRKYGEMTKLYVRKWNLFVSSAYHFIIFF